MNDLPMVSIAVVAYNAAAVLPALLEQILLQDYDHRRMELLLVNSASDDRTPELMRAFAEEADFPVQVLENPKRSLPAGCNVALRHYGGDLFLRLDAHSLIAPDFLSKNVQEIEKGHDIVGGYVGVMLPQNRWGAVLSAVDGSRFCGGVARFRNRGKPREVDTLAYAMYRRRVYDTVGFYDERLRRTEDNDMAYRMKKAGFAFYFTPEIQSIRHTRHTLRAMLEQKWENGRWIAQTLFIQPRCFTLRHFVPVGFLLGLLLCLSLALLGFPWPLWMLLGVYLAADLFFSLEAALRQPFGRLLSFVCLPWIFPLVHLAYGLGTLSGLVAGRRLARQPMLMPDPPEDIPENHKGKKGP